MTIKLGKLHHIALSVIDLTNAQLFYKNVFGLSPAGAPNETSVWYDLPGGCQLHLVERDMEMVRTRDHFALEVADLDAWRQSLSAKGIELEESKVALYNAKRFFLRDPSGNMIELVQWHTAQPS